MGLGSFSRKYCGCVCQRNAHHAHTAWSAHTFLEGAPVEIMEWPAWKPDLNPPEHVWDRIELFIGDMELKLIRNVLNASMDYKCEFRGDRNTLK